MSVAAIRAQVKAILQGVANAGQVHDYDRWEIDWDDLLTRFKATIGGTDQIRGWTIHAQSDGARYPGTNNVGELEHLFLLRGYLSLKDSTGSEKVFDDLVEAVQKAFLGNYTLNGSAMNAEPPQVVVKEARQLSDVLVHYAELHLRVRERTTF
ncbi:MAG: hypothetical protein HY600_05540 [Candidatus Omnitrophica bacterium]|nr:hypothetical protein [Candidatus Omnitrophota bacterium]